MQQCVATDAYDCQAQISMKTLSQTLPPIQTTQTYPAKPTQPNAN